MSAVKEIVRANLSKMGRAAIAEYAFVLEELLVERERVLDAIPQCPAHGKGCVPWAVEWVESSRNDYAPPLTACPGAGSRENTE